VTVINMRTELLIALGVAMAGGYPKAGAQGSDEVAILRAARTYLGDTIPKGRVIIDKQTLLLRSDVAESVAQELGASVANPSGLVQCVDAPENARRPRSCTIRDQAIIVAFSQPAVQGDSAVVRIDWRYQARPGFIASESRTLMLVRAAKGRWQVSKVLEVGRS
jgi:hypothetical protein